jgi:type VI secretion system FHA domain protein
VLLTLSITNAAGTRSGESSRQVFTEDGGTIGRAASNTWVLTHNKVSGRHAVISFRNSVFYIEDTSRNGVSVNSPDNRLVRERPYALKAGDVIFIEPYDIDVSIDAGADHAAFEPLGDLFGDNDPFAPARGVQGEPPGVVPPPYGGGEVDPLKFFDSVSRPAPVKPPAPPVASSEDWLGEHYRPPVAVPDPAAPPPPPPKSDHGIPVDYNPLADESAIRPIPVDLPLPGEAPRRPKMKEPPPRQPSSLPRPVIPVRTTPEPVTVPPPVSVPPVSVAPAIDLPPVVAPPPAPVPVAPVALTPPLRESAGRDLGEVLAGAGLPAAAVTPELGRNLGEILRVVVAGLIDVLQSRQRIKEEFRMRQTVFRPADNNPLKFSANVDDALHNLLVKRNAAYLGPVEAFADAFDDLRDHQLAMLAGMRVAFESMLADFDPDRMQEEFDRQIAKVSLPLMPAKMRYWDFYREKRLEIQKDPEAAFARLFGEEFARAYEEQFRELRAQRRTRAAEQSKEPRPHKPE